MLDTDKSRGYCLEMICADFLAGANLDNEDPRILLTSISSFSSFCPVSNVRNFCRKQARKRHDANSATALASRMYSFIVDDPRAHAPHDVPVRAAAKRKVLA
jgi:hypothetical protein